MAYTNVLGYGVSLLVAKVMAVKKIRISDILPGGASVGLRDRGLSADGERPIRATSARRVGAGRRPSPGPDRPGSALDIPPVRAYTSPSNSLHDEFAMSSSPVLTTSRLALAGLVVVALAAPARLGAQESGTPAVRPGDRVTLTIFTAAGEPLEEVAGERIVDRAGQLFLPFVGEVEVAGMEAREIRELLVGRYSSYFSNPVVDVRTQIRVNVTGAVRSPGNFFVDPTSTVVDVLSRAGGITSEVATSGFGVAADLSRVQLVRDGETRVLDLQPQNVGTRGMAMAVQSGDWVHVPPRPRSRWRDNLQLAGSFLSVVGSVVGITYLIVR